MPPKNPKRGLTRGESAYRKAPSKPAAARRQSAKDKADERTACVREHFRKFDLNGDGKISHEEMSMVLSSLDPTSWTDAKIEALLQSIDRNNDGSINLDEFFDWAFGSAENTAIIEAVKAVVADGCEYVVLEMCDNMCAFLRTPEGKIVAALPYCRESGGFGPDFVFAVGRAFTAESAFRNCTLPKNIPVVIVLDAARPGGNYMPAAAFGLLASSGYDLSGDAVKIVVAAPTEKSPRVCMLGSSCFATRYFLWELQRAVAKHKFEGKVAFIPRESLYVGQETLYNTIIPAAVAKCASAPKKQRNIGSAAVQAYLKCFGGALKQHSKAMEQAGCMQPFRYASHEKFGQYIQYEPDKDDWPNSYPPGHGADPMAILSGHTSDLLVDADSTVLFELGDTPSQGKRVVDSRAAEASPEKVFMVTRSGLADYHVGGAARVLKEMCEDPGVTLWSLDKIINTFGNIPDKENAKYQDFLADCREAMDGICVLDLPVAYWVNDFLVDLNACDYISTVLVIEPGEDRERHDHDDGSGFDTQDFIDLKLRLPYSPISAVVLMPDDGGSDNDWAHAGAYLWHLRETCDGVIALPGSAARPGGWGAKFLSTWLSITSTTLMHRFKGHLGIAPPLNIFLAYYGEGDSSSAAIDHSHVLQKCAPLFATYTVSCGMQAGFRLEALLDRISKNKIFGSVTGGSLDELYIQAAGETSDDHGAGSLDQGAVRYATLVAGGTELKAMLEKCSNALVAKAQVETDWKDMVDGSIGLKTWILPEFTKVTQALSNM